MAKEKPIRLTLVRHAQATAAERSLSAAEEPPLTPLGRRQAQRLARRLDRETFDCVYSSVLRRCRETALAITALRKKTKWVETMDLVEVSRDHFLAMPQTYPPPPRETIEKERDAMLRFANRLRHSHRPGDRILAVAHGNLIRSLIPLLGGRDARQSVLMEIDNASVSILDVWPNETAVLLLANCTSHLADLTSRVTP